MHCTRRGFISSIVGAIACSALPRTAWAGLRAPRTLRFYNTHTGEKLNATYWERGTYNPDALASIYTVLRDHRTDETAPIDLRLLDSLTLLHLMLESNEPFQVISGYRSPKSNNMLYEHSSGVAKNSFHLQGKAIDIRLKDRALEDVRDAAISMSQGGVGYYASSEFVHIDTGKVRKW